MLLSGAVFKNGTQTRKALAFWNGGDEFRLDPEDIGAVSYRKLGDWAAMRDAGLIAKPLARSEEDKKEDDPNHDVELP